MSIEEIKTAVDEIPTPCLKCRFFHRDLNDCLFYGSSWIEVPDDCPYEFKQFILRGVTSDEH